MGKHFEFVVLLIQAFVNRHKKYIILGFLAGFFATLFSVQLYPIYTTIKGIKEKKIAYIGLYNDNNLPLSIQHLISSGLTSLTDSGEATPSTVINWQVENNGLTYIFHLQPNLYWHDGSRFTANDVNYKLKDTNLSIIDQTTLKITIKEPYAPLPVLFSKPLLKNNLVGLGLYKVREIKYSDDIITALRLQPLKNILQPITYKFYPNTEEAINAFKRGEVNGIENISHINDLDQWKNIKIVESSLYDRYVGIFFNLKNSLFKEKEVRQALNYAVPPFRNMEKVYTPISPLSWAYSAKIRLFKYDPETAANMLSKNPISSNSAEITISTYSSHLETAQTVADAWKKVGIKTKVKVITSIPLDYDVLILAVSIPPDPDQYPYWQSTQDATNITHYSNLKIDKLLEDGRKTQDPEKRKKIYADFQRYLIDDSPVIFLYHPKVYTVERN